MFDHFGFLAPFYERFIKPKYPAVLSDLLDLPSNGTLLDVGGGTGRVSGFFVDQVGTVVIADLSEEMLLQSQSKNELMPTCSQSERLPFPEHYFEAVIMIDVLHHVYDQEMTARELWRVTKPGGKIIIEEPDISNWGVKLVALAEKVALMRSHFLSPAKIKELFDKYTDAIHLHKEGHNAWVVITKNESEIV